MSCPTTFLMSISNSSHFPDTYIKTSSKNQSKASALPTDLYWILLSHFSHTSNTAYWSSLKRKKVNSLIIWQGNHSNNNNDQNYHAFVLNAELEEKAGEFFHLQVHSPNGHNIWSCDFKTRSQELLGLVAETQAFEPSFVTLQGTMTIVIEQWQLKSVPI